MPEMGAEKVARIRVMSTTERDALEAVEGMVIFNSTTDQLEEYDGSVWQAVGQVIMDTHAADYGLHRQLVVKSANQIVNNSNTLVSDDDLLIAIAANEALYVQIVIRGLTNTSADWRFKVTGPSGATGGCVLIGRPGTLYATLGDGMSGNGYGQEECIVIHVIVLNSTTAGNIQLQWAQNVPDASDTTVYANSCLIKAALA